MITEDDGEAVFNEDAEHPITEYEATSNIGKPDGSLLRLTGNSYPDDIRSNYEQMPALDPRIPRLAQQITAQAHNNYDRAMAIENYLRTHFGYTLRLSARVLAILWLNSCSCASKVIASISPPQWQSCCVR